MSDVAPAIGLPAAKRIGTKDAVASSPAAQEDKPPDGRTVPIGWPRKRPWPPPQKKSRSEAPTKSAMLSAAFAKSRARPPESADVNAAAIEEPILQPSAKSKARLPFSADMHAEKPIMQPSAKSLARLPQSADVNDAADDQGAASSAFVKSFTSPPASANLHAEVSKSCLSESVLQPTASSSGQNSAVPAVGEAAPAQPSLVPEQVQAPTDGLLLAFRAAMGAAGHKVAKEASGNSAQWDAIVSNEGETSASKDPLAEFYNSAQSAPKGSNEHETSASKDPLADFFEERHIKESPVDALTQSAASTDRCGPKPKDILDEFFEERHVKGDTHNKDALEEVFDERHVNGETHNRSQMESSDAKKPEAAQENSLIHSLLFPTRPVNDEQPQREESKTKAAASSLGDSSAEQPKPRKKTLRLKRPELPAAVVPAKDITEAEQEYVFEAEEAALQVSQGNSDANEAVEPTAERQAFAPSKPSPPEDEANSLVEPEPFTAPPAFSASPTQEEEDGEHADIITDLIMEEADHVFDADSDPYQVPESDPYQTQEMQAGDEQQMSWEDRKEEQDDQDSEKDLEDPRDKQIKALKRQLALYQDLVASGDPNPLKSFATNGMPASSGSAFVSEAQTANSVQYHVVGHPSNEPTVLYPASSHATLASSQQTSQELAAAPAALQTLPAAQPFAGLAATPAAMQTLPAMQPVAGLAATPVAMEALPAVQHLPTDHLSLQIAELQAKAALEAQIPAATQAMHIGESYPPPSYLPPAGSQFHLPTYWQGQPLSSTSAAQFTHAVQAQSSYHPAVAGTPSSPMANAEQCRTRARAAAHAEQSLEQLQTQACNQQQPATSSGSVGGSSAAPLPEATTNVIPQAEVPAQIKHQVKEGPSPNSKSSPSKVVTASDQNQRNIKRSHMRLHMILEIDGFLVDTLPWSRGKDVDASRLKVSDKERELNEVLPAEKGGRPIHVKFRPHARWFFRELIKLYEFSIFSKEPKKHTHEMVNCLDPTNQYIHRTIVRCQEHESVTGPVHVNNIIKRGFPVQQVLILEKDTNLWSSVSKAHPDVALMKVIPYTYFADGKAEGRLLDDRDVYLLYLARFCVQLHAAVFSSPSPFTKPALSNMWRKTLKDVKLCALVRPQSLIPRAVKLFGASLEKTVHADLHLVVVEDRKHESIKLAYQLRLPLVDTKWLSLCMATFTLQDPTPFILSKGWARSMWEGLDPQIGKPGVETPTGEEVMLKLEKMRVKRLSSGQQEEPTPSEVPLVGKATIGAKSEYGSDSDSSEPSL